MTRTIEQIRIEKGFETAGEFAKFLGMPSPNYSLVATGKKSPGMRLIIRLKNKYPNDDFSDLISDFNNENNTIEKRTAHLLEEHRLPLKFNDQMEKSRIRPFRSIFVFKPRDRGDLPELLKGDLQDVDTIKIMHDNLSNPREDYFGLEIGQEPYFDSNVGDRVLCYEVKPSNWWRIGAGSTVLVYSSTRPDLVIKVKENLLITSSPATFLCEPLTWKISEIKHIYQIDSLHRKL